MTTCEQEPGRRSRVARSKLEREPDRGQRECDPDEGLCGRAARRTTPTARTDPSAVHRTTPNRNRPTGTASALALACDFPAMSRAHPGSFLPMSGSGGWPPPGTLTGPQPGWMAGISGPLPLPSPEQPVRIGYAVAARLPAQMPPTGPLLAPGCLR